MRIPFLLLTALSLLLASCSAPAAPAATTPPPTPTSTPGVTASATASPIPETATPAPDLEATAHFATSTAVVEALLATTTPTLHAAYPSPDQKWRAEVVIYDCTQIFADYQNAFEQLQLVDVETGAESVVATQLLNCGGLGAAGLDVVAWSPNSRYVYFTDAREGVPDGCGGAWIRPVHRADVTTLAAEPVGPGLLSPDETQMAFWEQGEIVVWSLDQGEIGRAPVEAPDVPLQDIAWSPDGIAIAYLQLDSNCPPSGRSLVTRLDPAGFEQTLLIESESPSMISLRWESADRLALTDSENGQWQYDLASGELEPLP